MDTRKIDFTFCRLIISAVLGLLLLQFSLYATQETTEPTIVNDIKISFKLDPRITRNQYMGDIWVSQPIYSGTSGQDIVEAKAQGLDANGKPISVSPEWTASDPEMVTLSTRQGNDVKITVLRAGESKLKVSSLGFTKELAIKAYYKNNVINISILAVGKGQNP